MISLLTVNTISLFLKCVFLSPLSNMHDLYYGLQKWHLLLLSKYIFHKTIFCRLSVFKKKQSKVQGSLHFHFI